MLSIFFLFNVAQKSDNNIFTVLSYRDTYEFQQVEFRNCKIQWKPWLEMNCPKIKSTVNHEKHICSTINKTTSTFNFPKTKVILSSEKSMAVCAKKNE